MTLAKRTFSVLFAMSLVMVTGRTIQAQGTVTGPTSVTAGSTVNYTLVDDIIYSSPNWQASIGTVNSSSRTGVGPYTYRANITFNGGLGTCTVSFFTGSTLVNSLDVTVTCPTVNQPSAAISYNYGCGSTTVSTVSTPPSGEGWYWQTSASGTTLAVSNFSNYIVTSPGTYYLRSINFTSGCWGPAQAFSVAVNLVPDVAASSQSICTGLNSSILISNPNSVPGTTFNWTVTTVNVTGASNSSGNLINQTLSLVDGTTTGLVSYVITPVANGCAGNSITRSVTVNPLPQITNLPSPVALCSGTALNFAASYSTGNGSVSWTSAFTGPLNSSTISTSGTGNITDSPQNVGNIPGVITYTLTPTRSGCTGSTKTYTVTVNPIPGVAVTPDQTICSGLPTNFVLSDPKGVSGVSFSWGFVPSNVSGSSAGSGNVISQALSSTDGLNNGYATYSIYASANGCNSGVVYATATVKPVPQITNLAFNLEGCSPYAFNFTPVANIGSTTFSWTSSVTGSVTGNSANGNGTIGNTLTNNSGSAAGSVSYNVTPALNGCNGTTKVLTVSVNPKPTISIIGSPSLTYGSSTTLTTGTAYSYQWTRSGTNLSTQQSYPVENSGAYLVTTQVSASALPCTSASINVNTFLSAQPQAVNYVSTTRINKKGVQETSSLFTLAPKDLVQGVAYQDGLGRTFQTVAIGQSPGQTDIVSPIGYGKQGLVDTTFLPYVTSAKQGTFRLNAIRAGNSYNSSEQKLFYQNTSLIAQDAKPFARSVHKASPDARVVEQGAHGTDWQPGTGHTVTNNQYLNGTSYPVRYFKADGTTTESYPANTVAVAITTDENGNQVRTFTNSQGQTVLKQVQLDDVISGSTVNWLQTYYIYDSYGRLVYQVPPKATALLGTTVSTNVNGTNVAELIYKYTYDTRGRLTQKKVPGAAVKYFVYDKLNRVVLTQDGNQRASNKWAFVKYDTYGRAVYSGIYTNTTQTTLATVQALFDGIDYSTQPAYESPAVNATTQGYSNTVFPTSNLSVMAVNYYDDYDFDRNGTPDYTYDAAHLSGLPATASTATRNLPTGSKKQIVGTANWLVSVVFYDDLDRPIQTQSNNHLNLAVQDKSSVKYVPNDLAIHVERTKQTHAGPTAITIDQRYTYDHAWRTLAIFHTLNGGTEVQVAGYTYNALGQVVDKQLHVVGGTPLQSVDYRYNIRGWLKSVNNAQLTNDANATNDDSNDYFGMELSYNTIESGLANTQYYNGNVSAAKWKGPYAAVGVTDQRSYKYTYDKSDKLKTAVFQAHDGAAWAKEANTLNENMTYEHNGNILTLLRNQNNRGLSGATVTSAAQAVDNLTYSYTTNTNRLLKVEDAATATGGFNNLVNVATEYTYNTDGSLNKDLNKDINTISFNILGKPQVVTYNGTPAKTVTYTYDAAGVKIKTVTVANSVTTTTDYIGGFVYTNNSLSFLSSPEGRIVKNGANYEYQYAIADHQGNTRVVFSSVAPTPTPLTATFEGDANDNANQFSNVTAIPFGSANHTPGGVNVVRLNQATPAGPGYKKKVYPGDKIDMEAWSYYESSSGYGTNNTVATMVTSIASAFGGVSGGAGESGLIYNGVNTALTGFGLGANQGDGAPAAYLNYILFDQQYKVVDMGWQVITASAFSKNLVTIPQRTVKEAGYVYVYLSYENASNNFVYFDDFKVTVTPTNVVQYNEYYPFGLSTANSWTRENSTGNNFLFNGGTELNTTTSVYDLHYRNYDPVLGRMNQVDPLAGNYASATPYNYAFNSPTNLNDPLGDDPNGNCSWCNPKPRPIDTGTAGGGGGGDGPFAGLMGRSAGFFEPGWQPGSGSLSAGTFGRSVYEDARDVRNGSMSLEAYAAKYGSNLTLSDMALTMAAITGSSVIGNTIASMTYGGLFSFQVNGKDYGGNFVVINGSVESLAFSYSLPTDIGGLVARGNTILVDVGPGQSYQSALNSWANNARGADMMGLTLAGGGAVLSMTEDMFRGVAANLLRLQGHAYDMGIRGDGYTKGINTASRAATGLKVAGYGFGAYNAYSVTQQYLNSGKSGFNTWNLIVEQGSNAYSTLGGLYGAAWGVGWELGRAVTNIPSYQEWRNSTWLPFREKYLGY